MLKNISYFLEKAFVIFWEVKIFRKTSHILWGRRIFGACKIKRKIPYKTFLYFGKRKPLKNLGGYTLRSEPH